jgi:outer membrane receptor for ferrienterochelin and colicins
MTLATTRSIALSLLVAVILLSHTANGQSLGSILGRVTDGRDGHPLRDIGVAVSGARAAATDADGRYIVNGVAPGQHSAIFRWLGYAPRTMTVFVRAGETSGLDAALTPLAQQLGEVIVTAGSRVRERVLDAPAAIVVADASQLRALVGTGQTPMLIGGLPGVRLAQAGMFDFNLNARGFNSPTNRRVLVLIDGRDTSVPILGNQDWADIVVLEDASHVELVRGPGAALYGANAFNGVLSIVTPAVRDEAGTRVNLTAGDHQSLRTDGRWARLSADNHWGARVTGGYQRTATWDRSRTGLNDMANEYAPTGIASGSVSTPAPGYELAPLAGQTKPGVFGVPASALGTPDPVLTYFGAARADYYPADGSVVTAEGGYGRVENTVIETGAGRSQVLAASRPWARLAWTGEHSRLFGYYTGRDGRSMTLGSAIIGLDHTGSYHLEGEHNGDFAGSRGRYVVGASLRDVLIDSRGTILALKDDGRHDQFYAAFEQVDFKLTDALKLVVASRLDQGTLRDAQFSPKLGLVLAPSRDQSLRLTWNRGFLSPSALQRFLSFPAGPPLDLRALEAGLRASPLGPALAGVPNGTLFTTSSAVPLLALGNERMKSERVNGFELGYKVQAGNLFATVDLYHSDLYDFGTTLLAGSNPAYGPWTAPGAVPEAARAAVEGAVAQAVGVGLSRTTDGASAYVLSFGNAGKAREDGAEVSAGYRMTSAFRLDANYSWYGVSIDQSRFQPADTIEANTPAHSANASLAYVKDNGWQGRVGLRYSGEYRFRSGLWHGTVPASVSTDVSASAPVRPWATLSVVAENLFDQRRFQVYGGSIIGRRLLLTSTVHW